MKPIYIHSGMAGAPQYANADGNINAILEACLVNGFNSRTATSASASGGVLTLNFASDPGFEPLQTVEVAVSSVALVNGQHRVVANSNNQVTIAIAGLPDGAVGSSGAGITIKQAGAGWSKPFSNSTVSVFRPSAGNRRFVRVSHAAGSVYQARGYESMSGVDAGGAAFPTVAQSPSPTILSGYPSANSAWFLHATDKWMSFSLAITPNGPITYSSGFFFFGDIAESSLVDATYDTFISSYFGLGYLCRGHTAVSSVFASIDFKSLRTGAWDASEERRVRFLPYVVVRQDGDNIVRGVLPCAYYMQPNGNAHEFSRIFSDVGGIQGRVKPIFLEYSERSHIAVSLDDEDWS